MGHSGRRRLPPDDRHVWVKVQDIPWDGTARWTCSRCRFCLDLRSGSVPRPSMIIQTLTGRKMSCNDLLVAVVMGE